MRRLVSVIGPRKQSVLLRGTNVKSETIEMNVGVPHSTLCGPILWKAFVDSLQFSEGRSIKYAEDTPATIQSTAVIVILRIKPHLLLLKCHR